MSKRENGVFYTVGNPFSNPAFEAWADEASLPDRQVLEPFAGQNSLITRLADMGLCKASSSYDISPTDANVIRQDTLKDFPKGFEVCVTNPPWLAKNSATARGLAFPDTRYDDLYKLALEKCLENTAWIAALVPESFIRANLFQSRLTDFVSLTGRMFNDTQHPVGLALFAPRHSNDVEIWRDDEHLGHLHTMRSMLPMGNDISVSFNEPEGNVGLIALDNTIEASIRFCDVAELADYDVKSTGRHITKMQVDGDVRIDDWNDCLDLFRAKTHDVLMTCYKGIRKDGFYRRRLDWATARGIVNHVH